MAKPEKAKQERVFRSSLKPIGQLTALSLPVVVGLGVLAAWGNRIAPAELQDPLMRGMCFYFPLVMIALILAGLALLFHVSAGISITLRPDVLIYEQRGFSFKARWGDLTLVKPPPDAKGRFLQALVSDGTRFGRIDKILFKDYELILSVIEHARQVHRDEHRV